MNKLIAPAKKVLAREFGFKNVSVKNGSGTAWGWVKAHISINRPYNCFCDSFSEKNYDNHFGVCQNCRHIQEETYKNANLILLGAWKNEGLKPYTFCSDDGFSSEINDVNIQVDLI